MGAEVMGQTNRSEQSSDQHESNASSDGNTDGSDGDLTCNTRGRAISTVTLIRSGATPSTQGRPYSFVMSNTRPTLAAQLVQGHGELKGDSNNNPHNISS